MKILKEFTRKIRKSIALKKTKKDNSIQLGKSILKNTNLTILGKNNLVEIKTEKISKKATIKIKVEGNNNKIIIGENLICNRLLDISIYGDNCSVILGDNLHIGTNLSILLGQNHPFHGKIENAHCQIGHHTRIEEAGITTYNANNKIEIGNNCLISLGVHFYNTDAHPIYSKQTGQLQNHVSDMIIGDDCWIGYDATLLKGAQLANHTIVGWGSIVSKKFTQEFVAIAGNPAKIVKKNVSWNFGGDIEYIQNKREKNE